MWLVLSYLVVALLAFLWHVRSDAARFTLWMVLVEGTREHNDFFRLDLASGSTQRRWILSLAAGIGLLWPTFLLGLLSRSSSKYTLHSAALEEYRTDVVGRGYPASVTLKRLGAPGQTVYLAEGWCWNADIGRVALTWSNCPKTAVGATLSRLRKREWRPIESSTHLPFPAPKEKCPESGHVNVKELELLRDEALEYQAAIAVAFSSR